jgi:hypothetical protein
MDIIIVFVVLRAEEAEASPEFSPLPPRVLDCPARVLDCPARVLDCPARVLDCPARVLDCPARVLDCPARVLDCPIFSWRGSGPREALHGQWQHARPEALHGQWQHARPDLASRGVVKRALVGSLCIPLCIPRIPRWVLVYPARRAPSRPSTAVKAAGRPCCQGQARLAGHAGASAKHGPLPGCRAACLARLTPPSMVPRKRHLAPSRRCRLSQGPA